MDRRSVEKGTPVLFLLKCLLSSYIITTAMLLLLAFMLYKVGLKESVVSIAIIAVYVISTFAGGFIAGKKMQNRKFIWGLIVGVAYFVVLAVVSLVINQSITELGDSVFTTLILCGAGGMLGGMLG